ncbi:MAG TPA: ankyrin repeat domain-containing protein [Caulobacteraceae bacterium]|jgi:hypothetical protein
MTAGLRDLLNALAATDPSAALALVNAAPALATERSSEGARRGNAQAYFAPALGCYLNEGDTALHLAAAAWRADLITRLVALGADAQARNRMGATPLHLAANGDPQSPRWRPDAQAAALSALLAAGADPNAVDKHGATPLHKAVRTRCAAAVEALLDGGADPALPTRNAPPRCASPPSPAAAAAAAQPPPRRSRR